MQNPAPIVLLTCLLELLFGCSRSTRPLPEFFNEPPPETVEVERTTGIPLPKHTPFDYDLKAREEYLDGFRSGYRVYAAGRDWGCVMGEPEIWRTGWSAGSSAGIGAHYRAEKAKTAERSKRNPAEMPFVFLSQRAQQDFENRLPGVQMSEFSIGPMDATNVVFCDVEYRVVGDSNALHKKFSYKCTEGTNWSLVWDINPSQ